MQELVGRLTALDPEASETLKVIAYFDTLVTTGAGLDALLRGAAALSGAVAGAERDGRSDRRGPDGTIVRGEAATRSPERATAAGRVWLERVGASHANDAMIVERLAIAADLIEARRRPTSDLDVAIDLSRTLEERTAALAKLRVTPGSLVRVLATQPETVAPGGHSTIVPTRFGLTRATLAPASIGRPHAGPLGIGQSVRADHAPESWEGAVIALRLTEPATPVVDATDLGALLMLARTHDADKPHEDVLALARLDERSARFLRVLVEADSLRAAASALGVHHSTLQARHETLTHELGYDPRTPGGKARYAAAELLLRLTDLRPQAASGSPPGD